MRMCRSTHTYHICPSHINIIEIWEWSKKPRASHHKKWPLMVNSLWIGTSYISIALHQIGCDQNTIDAPMYWMVKNYLCLNNEKTQSLFIASPYSHQKSNIPHIPIGSAKIAPATDVWNYDGFNFDCFMNCKMQITTPY